MTDETIVANIDDLEEGEKRPYLSFVAGPRLGQLIPIDSKPMTVGRSPDCDLWVEDNAISRKHFKIWQEGSSIRLEDLKSTNGTFVNGSKAGEADLADGDRIQISKITILELTFLDESRSRSEKQLYEMGVMDAGTGIHNKRYFLDRIREEFSVAQRKSKPLALVMFDIDHFKKLNDTYGHVLGDLVLQQMSAEVSKVIRTGDLFARYGGEEFAVVMRDAELPHAARLAERIRTAVENMTVEYEGQTVKFTVSLGYAPISDQHRNEKDLIAEADKYLYRSKEGGRNRATGPS